MDWGAPLDAGWQPLLQAWAQCPAGLALNDYLDARRQAAALIYPPDPLAALRLTRLSSCRVVILGQDPYHGPGQAEGLAFSVAPGCKFPPSLRNIFKELQRDLGQQPPMEGSLKPWAARGVLLLNTVLTVEDGAPASHAGKGWEAFTDALIQAVAEDAAPKVFMLWGAHAQAKAPLIEAAGQGAHLILQANHPSPLSALRPPLPFIGCGHFSQAAQWLAQRGELLSWELS